MRNRPQIGWDIASWDADEDGSRAADDSSVMRFRALLLILLLPIVAIGGRLSQLQSRLGPRYVSAWETTTVREEPLPCRDGRILSADGQVLAQDRLRFDVLVHYRWIEDPPDERWLRQRALSRLTRPARRDSQAVAAAQAEVLRERDRLWQLLAETTGDDLDELVQARSGIQRRVERIVEHVTRRRDERLADSQRQLTPNTFPHLSTLRVTPQDLQQIGDAVVGELTTPPRRSRAEPIIVAEELSHHVVVADVPLSVVAEMESAPSLFPGVRIQARSERTYPAADLAGHLVGVRTEVTPEDALDSADAPDDGDRIGRFGIERAFDQTLRGRRGKLKLIEDRHGETLSQTVVDEPIHGRDVVMTIDAQLQRTAEKLLDESLGERPEDDGSTPTARRPQGGCLIAMDVRTGDVITAAAAPRYDLGLLLHPDPDEWQAVTGDERRPFFPRITQMTVPPGSVFKILTSIALLESKIIDPNVPFHCQGFLDRPDRNRCYIYRHYGIGHGDMALSDAICQSCNVYFFNAARSLGPQAIAEWAARFGLGVPTGGEVPGEKGGHLPRASGGRIVGEQWYNGSTLQFAIGQASLTVTPLQVARMVAAVANGGYLVTPRFVQDDVPEPQTAASAIELVSFSPESAQVQRIPGLSPETLVRVREGMRLVVDHPKGTGKRARIEGVSIAGKTGTAEVGGRKADHAWFVGFVPAEAPRIAFVVVLEHGGSGGAVAAPVAKRFINAMADAGVIARDSTESSDISRR